jgi:hypothetical protein
VLRSADAAAGTHAAVGVQLRDRPLQPRQGLPLGDAVLKFVLREADATADAKADTETDAADTETDAKANTADTGANEAPDTGADPVQVLRSLGTAVSTRRVWR